MRTFRIPGIANLVLLSTLGGCASALPTGVGTPSEPETDGRPSASAPSSAPGSVSGPELDKLFARELGELPKRQVASDAVTGEVEGASTPVTAQTDRSLRIDVPLGTQVGVTCFVYPEVIDAGAQIQTVLQEVGKHVEVRSIRPTDVVLVDDQVAVFVDAKYLAHKGQEVLAGELKIMAFPHALTSMLCMHDEPGYKATFKRVTLGLASSLRKTGWELARPRFVEVTVAHLGGLPVGYTRTALLDGEGGKAMYTTLSTTLIPRSPTDLAVEDTGRLETWDRSGAIARVVFKKGQGDEMTDDLVLTKLGPREYSYEGTHQGKKLAGKLATRSKGGLPTDAASRRQVQKLLQKGATAADVRVERYEPGEDPTASVDQVWQPVSRPDRTVTVSLGGAQISATVDAGGLVEHGELPVGSATLTLERALIRGSL